MSVSMHGIYKASDRLKGVVAQTPLSYDAYLSDCYEANVYLKREDLQKVRSYKLRGALNKMVQLSPFESKQGVVCASAGNHAQGVAYACKMLGVKGRIYLPVTTPKQKLRRIEKFGQDKVELVLKGDTFDDSYALAKAYANQNNQSFIHPFDDKAVVEGQATVGLEILNCSLENIDYLFVPVGGGGLASGLVSVFSQISPKTKIIGVEPKEAASMTLALNKSDGLSIPTLEEMDSFIDGASVRKVGALNYAICKNALYDMLQVEIGEVCTSLLDLYENNAIVVEPAGALSVAGMNQYKKEIKGKTVVCVLSGGNNDITRMEEIKERALLFQGLKHYFVLRFPQRAGALREFASDILGPHDDITHFEYVKKHNRSKGPSVVGIELKNRSDFEPLLDRIVNRGYFGEYLNERPDLFQYLV